AWGPPGCCATRRPTCWPSTSSCTTSWAAAPARRCAPTRRARRWHWHCCRCRWKGSTISPRCAAGRRTTAMAEDLVLYEPRPPAVVLTLNRPDRRNALCRGLITALGEAFARARDDAAARSVVLTGAGPAFCAGMDLAEL